MPPLPPTPTGKPLIFDKTISFSPFANDGPPLYRDDCLPEPPVFRNPFAWDGKLPQVVASPTPTAPMDPQALAAGDHNGSTLYQHQRFNAVVRGQGQVEVSLRDGLAAVVIGMAAQESAQLEVMRNAGNPKLAIVHPGPLSAGAREAIAQKFTSDHGGAENAGKPLVLAEGMRVERISSTLEDSGISAARQYSIADVSRIYGVPVSYLGETTNAYGSMEWLSRMYVDACLAHWFAAFKAESLAKLAGPADSFEFDIETRATIAAWVDAYLVEFDEYCTGRPPT